MRWARTATSPASASTLDGAGDRQDPPCRYRHRPDLRGPVAHDGHRPPVQGRFNDYTMEVVQQIGSDSFAPGHGVLIGKSKTRSSTCGTYSCFVWYIDSNPQDINQVDYVKADGTPVKATPGDERQLNDGSFNAGINSGSQVRVQGRRPTACTSTSSTSARTRRASCATRSASARSTAPARRRAASRWRTRRSGTAEGFATCTFPLKNTGAAAAIAGRRTRRTRRRTSTATSTACRRRPPAPAGPRTCKNALATAKFGETVQVPVYIEKAAGAAADGSVTLTATSESDPTKTQSVTCSRHRRHRRRLGPGDARPDDGRAGVASARSRPGAQKDYFASTTATVISTAGDATLSVADPAQHRHRPSGQRCVLAARAAAGAPAPRRGTYAPVGGSASPTTLKTYAAPGLQRRGQRRASSSR